MANRLSRIVTRTGDDGSTGLASGVRVGKDDARIAALGDIDELNSLIGLLRCEPLPARIQNLLSRIQHDLFDAGGELSLPGHELLTDMHLERLESHIEDLNGTLPPLKEFILPGGTRPAALAHVARTVCRRAERSVVHLGREAGDSVRARRYLNRLSDLLFVLARYLNREAGEPDVLWQAPKPGG